MKRRVRSALALAVLGAGPAAFGAEESVSGVFRRVKDAVVVVRTQERERAKDGTLVASEGLGSGVLVSSDGKVLTASHVVQVAESIEVAFPGGETSSARVIGIRPWADVALLQIDEVPEGVTPASLGDSDAVEVGDTVLVVGAPLGITHTLTVGHVSGRRMLNVVHGPFSEAEFLQTDASVNTGNSGGPMFNLRGEVVGIVSHVITGGATSAGLGFAATSKMVRDLVDGSASPWWGMEGIWLDEALARVVQVPQPRSLLVQRVAEGSPASRLGLLPGSVSVEIEDETVLLGGDVILEVEGINLSDPDALPRLKAALARTDGGRRIRVQVLRSGKRVELSTGP